MNLIDQLKVLGKRAVELEDKLFLKEEDESSLVHHFVEALWCPPADGHEVVSERLLALLDGAGSMVLGHVA